MTGRGMIARSALVIALGLAVAAPRAHAAKGDDDDERADDGDDGDDAPKKPAKAAAKKKAAPRDDGDDDDGGKAKPAKAKAKAKAAKKSDDEDDGGDGKGDGDDGGDDGAATPAKKGAPSEFEKDRFFVDKVDSGKTASGTLIQGSFTSTSLLYREGGGAFAGSTTDAQGSNASKFSRMFTDLRAQVDFRHLSGGTWDLRVDGRVREVSTPDPSTLGYAPTDPTRIQSGLTGQNEYELRELYLVRGGQRTDLFFGRQFVPDLAAVKIDGVRFDYASSSKFTLLGFGGLYPVRGSRSLATDYPELKNNNGASVGRTPPVAAGFGAAYRTVASYGAVGGVVIYPLHAEQPRAFATSNGYWRTSATLDFYHYAVVDVVGSAGFALTNASLGVNYKPSPRMRITANLNHVDTETLNVQANAFLGTPDKTESQVQNEVAIQRIATTQARAGLSVGLGPLERFEVTVIGAFRYRPEVTLSPPGGAAGTAITLNAAQGVEIYGSFIDRHSVKDLRLGVDASRTFGVGAAFQRNETLALRVFGGREVAAGRGEVEAELAYATTKDTGSAVGCADLTQCFGTSAGSIYSLGGTGYYRFNRDWFGVASLFLSQTALTHGDAMTATADPTITGITGFARLAYRF
jgi:hypothetical protein